QTLTYTVTAFPSATLCSVASGRRQTLATPNSSSDVCHPQRMQFKTAANANGGPTTFSFSVQDNGTTNNGGVDTLLQSLTITVTRSEERRVGNGVDLGSLPMM